MAEVQFNLPGIPGDLDKREYDETGSVYEFDRLIDPLARLYAYANTIPHPHGGELNERGERLARDDLLNVAIHARRFLTIVKAEGVAKNVHVPLCTFHDSINSMKPVPLSKSDHLWRILNVIVHYEDLEIVTSSSYVDLVLNKKGIGEAILNVRYFLPTVLVRSDHVAWRWIELRYFVARLFWQVIEPVADCLSEKGIYLESVDREL